MDSLTLSQVCEKPPPHPTKTLGSLLTCIGILVPTLIIAFYNIVAGWIIYISLATSQLFDQCRTMVFFFLPREELIGELHFLSAYNSYNPARCSRRH